MKTITGCAILLLLFPSLLSAQEPCGTIATPDVLRWWDVRAQTLQSIARKGTQAYTVPVHIHIVGDDNGNGYYATANAYELICELNTRFAPMQISFFMDDSVTHINNGAYTNPSAPYVNQMMNAYNRSKVCNIYLVPQLTGLCGYTYFPAQGPALGRGGIVLKNGCSLPGNSDPTHEMGHYFSLLHTFQDWNTANAELVNGSNCATKGDHFCDTRADWQDFRWNCPYTGNKQDANGDYYMPDSSLYMGYSNAPCPSRFSPQQQAAIIYSRANDRLYLDSVSMPYYPALIPASLMLPVDGDMSVPSSANAAFRWHKVAGATGYNLRISLSSASSFSNTVLNVVTTDTFYTVNTLQPSTSYRWEVLPVNYVATCITPDASGIERRAFSVVYANSVGEVGGGIEQLSLYPNPAAATGDVCLSLTLKSAAPVMLQVIAVDGRILFSQAGSARAGKNTIIIPAASLSSGIYSVRLSSASFDVVRKFVKSGF